MAKQKLHPAAQVIQAIAGAKQSIPPAVTLALHAEAVDCAARLADRRKPHLADDIAALYAGAKALEPLPIRALEAKVGEGQVVA